MAQLQLGGTPTRLQDAADKAYVDVISGNLSQLTQDLYTGLQGTGSASSSNVQILLNNFFGSSGSWLSMVANLFGAGGNSATGKVLPSSVGNVLGGAHLAADLTNLMAPFTSIGALTSMTAWQQWQSGLMNLLGATTTTVATGAATQVPSTKITNVLGGGSLGADVTALLSSVFGGVGGTGTASTSALNTQLTNFITNLFGTGNSPTSSTLHIGVLPTGIPQSYIQDLETDLSNAITTGNWNPLLQALFGTTTFTTTTPIQVSAVPTGVPAANIANIFGGATLGADLTNLANALFGSTSVTSTSKVSNTSITNIFGGATLGADLTNLANALFGITTVTNTSKVNASSVANVLGGANLGADLTSVNGATVTNATNINSTWSWLFNTTTPTSSSLVSPTKLSNIFGGATLNADLTNLANALFGITSVTSASKVKNTSVANIFGGATLGADLTNLANALFGTTAVTATIKALPTSIANVLGGANLSADLTSVNTTAVNALPQLLWQTATGSGTNLVISPQFDDSTVARETASAGTGSAFGYTTAQARSGTQSYRIQTSTLTSGQSDTFYLSSNTLGGGVAKTTASALKVQSGQWFYGEIYVRAAAGNTTTAGSINLEMTLHDSTGVNAALNHAIASVSMSGLSSSAWTKLSGWYQIPAGYDLAWTFVWTLNQNVATQTFYFDDVRLVEETLAQALTQQLFGGSSILTSILPAAVPSLDTSKITTGTFPQSMISGLTSALNTLLPTTTYQSLVDALANGLGHSGTGHTWTDIETYVGIIPPANITNVLGGANLAADLSSVNTTTNTNTTNLSNTWSWLFNTTTPTSSSLVQTAKLSNIFGGATLSADLTNLANALFGGTTVTNTSKVNNTSIANIFGGATLGADLTNLANALFGTTAVTNTSKVNNTSIANIFGGATLGADLTNLATALFGGTTVTATTKALPTSIANVLGGANLSADLSSVNSTTNTNTTNLSNTWSWLFNTTTPTSSSLVQTAKLTNIFGGATLSADLTNLANALFGSTSVTNTSKVNNTSIANIFGGATLGADLTNLANALFGTTAVTATIKALPTSIANVLGGANLGADLSAVNTTATTNTGNINNTWSWLFGTTSPTSSTPVQNTKIANIFGGSNLGADLTNLATALFGATTVTSTTKALPTSIANVLGGANLSADLSAVNSTTNTNATNVSNTWNWLFGTTSPTSSTPVQNTKIANVFGNANLAADLSALATALGMGATVTNTSKVAPASVAQVLGQGSLSADLTALGNLFFGSPTVGTAVQSSALPNIPAGSGPGQSGDLLTHFNDIAALGNTTATTALAAARAALQMQSNTLSYVASQIQGQQTSQTATNLYGQAYNVYFYNYPDTVAGTTGLAAFAQAPFILNQTGAGNAYLSILNGNAHWVKATNSADNTVVGIYVCAYLVTLNGPPTGGTFTISYNGTATSAITYNATAATVQSALQAIAGMPANNVTVTGNAGGPYTITFIVWPTSVLTAASSLTGTGAGVAVKPQGYTNTDSQKLSATIATLPSGTNSRNYAIVRSDATGQNFTYAGVYLNSSSQLCWEVGYVVGGVDQGIIPGWSGVNAPLSFSFELRAGVGGNSRRFQGVSGSQIVFDKIDTGAVTPLGVNNRYFGFRSQTASSGAATPADASFVGCSDNALPITQGSGFRLSCSSTTQQAISVGTNTSPPGANPAWGYFPVGFFDTATNITADMVQSSWSGLDAITVLTEGKYLFSLRAQMMATAATGVVSIYCAYLRNGVFEQIANGPSVTVNVFSTTWAPTALGGTAPVYCKSGDQIVPIIYVDTQPGTANALSSLKVFGEANHRLTYWSLDRMFGT